MLPVARSRALSTLGLLALGLGGCGLFSKSEDEPVQEVTTSASAGRPAITVGELDQLARNYSDRLIARVSTACDRIKREIPEEEPRRRAHDLKLSVAMAAYDIVTSPGGTPQVPGAAQHLIDLAILTELHAVRWIEEHEARELFGGRAGERLAEAFAKSRDDVWQLLGRVMKPEQMDKLKTMILTWRRQNAEVEWLARVRLDVIAQGEEGAGFTKSVGEGFNPLKPIVRAADEMRLLVQQALFYAKRAPTLADWTAEAAMSNALEVPKVEALLRGLTGTVATLQKLLEPSSEEPAINSTIEEIRETLLRAKELVQEVHALQEAVQPLIRKHQAKTEANGVEPAPAEKPGLDEVMAKGAGAARDATSLVRETRALAESPSAMKNVDRVLTRTSENLSETGNELIDRAKWAAVQVVLLAAILVVLYKVVAHFLRKRRAQPAEK